MCHKMVMRKTVWGLRHFWYCITAEPHHQQADVRWYQKAALSDSVLSMAWERRRGQLQAPERVMDHWGGAS